ncbi:hydroxymethylbilane synthase [Paenibacillus turicensis]|uniref:Porphobilinogen deaminase n=1 Tax=Paenibacillus turicensis TaxID=160487 RepID=A0ABS4FRG9_9BACL|nr:hydroxymethylbilane synthase [Paenibacillus turicensis]MBP1905024.1 hydroxymethylbilane synthase [Paenibacillus turicensis]
MNRTIVVGTRQSQLALTQTNQVISDLKTLCQKHGLAFDFEIKKIITKGDRILDVTLSKVGGKGLFVKEIEQAMLDGEIDFAVHSMKDMPSMLPEGLTTGAVPRREDPRDVLISATGLSLDELPEGAVVGTSSLRRSSQLLSYRPDLNIQSIRGNIDSRIRKLETEGFDAIVLASAGLNRMGWGQKASSYLPVELCLPAVGQGALGIECREDDVEVRQLLALYNDNITSQTVSAERKFLSELNGGCQIPIGAYATLLDDKKIELTGMVGYADGRKILKESMIGNDPIKLGEQLAWKLISEGAGEILAEARE